MIKWFMYYWYAKESRLSTIWPSWPVGPPGRALPTKVIIWCSPQAKKTTRRNILSQWESDEYAVCSVSRHNGSHDWNISKLMIKQKFKWNKMIRWCTLYAWFLHITSTSWATPSHRLLPTPICPPNTKTANRHHPYSNCFLSLFGFG